jgi:hypothetical protein
MLNPRAGMKGQGIDQETSNLSLAALLKLPNRPGLPDLNIKPTMVAGIPKSHFNTGTRPPPAQWEDEDPRDLLYKRTSSKEFKDFIIHATPDSFV